jgi:hypothetical protein
MPRDCNLSPLAVFNSSGRLSLSRSILFPPTAPRKRSASKPSQSYSSSASQSKIGGGVQSRARDVAPATICATRTDTRLHISAARKPAVEPTPTSTAIRRCSSDDGWRFALSADNFRLIPSPGDVVSTRSTHSAHHQTRAPGSSLRTDSSLPASAPCDAATHPRVVRQRRDDGCTRYGSAAQSNGAGISSTRRAIALEQRNYVPWAPRASARMPNEQAARLACFAYPV